MSQLTALDFQTYTPAEAASVVPGPQALFAVPLSEILPTQMNEGLTEVGKKAAGFDLINSLPALEANLLTDVEPVVIGPGGKLYLLDGHHTFTALLDSIWGSNPNVVVYVNVVANYSNMTESQFLAEMQANNLLLPLNNGMPEPVSDIPTSLAGLTSDVYRGLEYSILKNKSSKLFTSGSNISGAAGVTTPGLDKMTGFYSDFLEAAAYQDADGGLGLPYLSPGDIAIATDWNLSGTSTTTLPNVPGTVLAAQLPGFILSQNLVEGSGSASNTVYFAPGGITNATLSSGALAGNGTFTGITEINAGTLTNPIYIGTPNVGFILQLGADKGFTVTLNGPNYYTGGTSILAGTLIVGIDTTPGDPDDSALGNVTPIGASVDPNNVLGSVQKANGIIFNSLTEGNATLQIGTTAGGGTGTFSTSRPIAVGGEEATINVNGYIVSLNGQLISLGVDGDGVGNATGFSDLTIDDLSSADNGKLILSTASPYFYGNLIIGNTGAPTVEVMSDAAIGATTGPADQIGQIELNSGTLQTGASFAATERDIFLASGSQIDVDGNTTSWGTLTDVQRTLEILNSNTTTAGAISFSSFSISATAILQLAGGAAGETVTFTGGILQTGDNTISVGNTQYTGLDTLVIQPSSKTSLGTTEQILSPTAAATLVNGIAPVWIVENNDVSKGAGPYDFVTYGANGYVAATYDSTATLNASTATDVVALSGNATLTSSAAVYALNTEGKTVALGGNTLTIGDGTAADAAGLILASGSAVSNGTLAFGGSEGVIWLSGSNPTISAQITGANGLTFAGSGTVAISTAANVSGLVMIDSGTVSLTAANVFASAAGVYLADVKSKPSAANLTISKNNQFAVLDSVGSNSTITITSGAILTIGSGTLSSTITDSTATPDAITKTGSGLLDVSGGSISLAAGSSIAVTGGQMRIAVGALKNSAVAASAPGFVLSNGADLQFAQNGGGQYAGAISGAGTLHLIGGTLQLTGVANSYSGGTIVETGSTLDVTTANLPSINENITDAGGLIVFDQDFSGSFTGVISDGQEMGTGPTLSGSLDKDDSTNSNAANSNVTLTAAQTYTGATYIEAGSLTLGALNNTIADSSGVTLGRVGGAVDGQTASLVLAANNTIAALSSDAANTTLVFLDGNTLTIDPATGVSSSFGGTITDGSAKGSLVVDGTGTVTLASTNTFTGGILLEAGTLELGSALSAGTGAITFANDPTLKIDGTMLPLNTIDGFGTGGTIDLAGIANVAGSHADMNYATRVLTITEGSGVYTLDFDPNQNFSGEFFHLAPDAGGNGTDIIENDLACYCRGTLIRGAAGEIAIEDLAIGDLVMTRSGALRPVKWIGRRSYSGRFVLGRSDIMPVCIKAGALDDQVPRRDLFVSPNHAMYFDGVLIEARDLVNGVSIMQAQSLDKIEYFHIELETHDVIIAEGALSESFIDDNSRGMFHNGHEYAALYPDRATKIARYCAPRLTDGYEVDAARQKIARRAGLGAGFDAMAPQPGALHGRIDQIHSDRIAGWAQNIDHPEVPVCLDVFAGGRRIGQVLANQYRDDLEAAGLGSGHHSFVFVPPASIAAMPEDVEVRRALDGSALILSRAVQPAA